MQKADQGIIVFITSGKLVFPYAVMLKCNQAKKKRMEKPMNEFTFFPQGDYLSIFLLSCTIAEHKVHGTIIIQRREDGKTKMKKIKDNKLYSLTAAAS